MRGVVTLGESLTLGLRSLSYSARMAGEEDEQLSDGELAGTMALAFALALELDRDTADELLMKAGYALSNSSRWDLIIRYCIEHKIYQLYQVNCILNDFEQPLLG